MHWPGDPVIFFESQRLYDISELFEKEVPATITKCLSVLRLKEERARTLPSLLLERPCIGPWKPLIFWNKNTA